ncbi:hybrid sensor histidine kinase/response regulator [Rubellicoccus peritrichatus]|uniref:histidine kinase n=1 Tax=Rubellicoccus peritrichatus TaxID=3080537 RepID=A0AAQ3QQ08_9BACT|nr:hybrid sensor histidine kinase/response regulator [Puniceicoccus sp. CR14]WOO39698.1 hybrid sensor histidine kinase/response regulator [Puniceicoccus sp. CR14]
MSSAEDSFPMLDLYQQEVETQCGALNEGLLELEKDSTEAEVIESIMRAAHSLKGAARIVGIKTVGDVAHVLEDILTHASEGKISISADDVDVLLRAADFFVTSGQQSAEQMAAWIESTQHTAEDLIVDIKAIEHSDAAPAKTPPVEKEEEPTKAEPLHLADASMLDLFKTEAEEQLTKLSNGLVALEDTPNNLELIEPLMRAAHSLKGAARIVGLTPAVDVAHAMEDVLVAAQEGKVSLEPESIDVLLKATDWLSQISQVAEDELASWVEKHADEVDLFQKDLRAIEKGKPIAKKQNQAPPVEAPIEKKDSDTSASKDSSDDAAPASQSKEKSASASQASDSVVRVSAENLNRLMGLAAETLVETRRLEPFRDSLLKLKETQTDLNQRIDVAQRALEALNLDPTTAAELEFVRIASRANLNAIREQIDSFDGFSREHTLLSDRLYREVLDSRMRPFRDGVVGFPRLVRDIGRSLGKKIAFNVEGKDTPVDRDILEKLDSPLNHILRNACDHGLETPEERIAKGKEPTAHLRLGARHSAGMLVVEIKDDGRGIDAERVRKKILERELCSADMVENLSEEETLEFLFLPGFFTAKEVTQISGRGVGLDVVQTMMQEIGGKVRVSSEVDHGTQFTIEVPITRSVVRALILEIDGEPYAFPLNRIVRTLQLTSEDIRIVENRQYFSMDGVNVGLVSAHSALGLSGNASTLSNELTVVVVNDRNNFYGVEIGQLIGESDLVVRPLDPRLGKVPGISAASLTEDGHPLLIIDIEDLVQSIDKLLSGGSMVQSERRDASTSGVRRKRVLVVDDSITVRETERQLLQNAGYDVEVAVDGADGWNAVRLGDFDLVVSDIDMPRLNGFEFVKKIRSDNRLGRTPVVIVSYKDREEDRMKGLDAGADFYLTKSAFQDDTFIEAVEELIGDAHDAS